LYKVSSKSFKHVHHDVGL